MRAQASIEYILLIGIAMAIVVIGIGLYANLPNLGQDLQTSQYAAHWREQARPFLVEDAFYDKTYGRFYLSIRSIASEPFNLTGIFLNNTQLSINQYDAGIVPDGVGSNLCTAADCTLGCSCSNTIRPSAASVLAIQTFSSESEMCGSGGRGGRISLSLIYNRPSDLSQNFTETSPIPLAFTCK